jgi:hypothetical protein
MDFIEEYEALAKELKNYKELLDALILQNKHSKAENILKNPFLITKSIINYGIFYEK